MERRMGKAGIMIAVLLMSMALMGTPTKIGADNKVTIYVDTRGIDAWAQGPPPQLDAQQLAALKEWIIWDIQWNFNNAVGEGKVEVTNDPAKEAGSNRQVRITNDLGTHTKADGSTGYHYGEWKPKSKEVGVHLKNFVDRHGNDYKTDGKWDIQKLRTGIGRTCSHELGHSYCIGHNNDVGIAADKMTEGGNVPSEDRANRVWVFDTHSKDVLKNNLGKPPCDSTKDYDEEVLIAHFYDGPDLPCDPDDWGAVDAIFSFSGPNAHEFELGWYGKDTDNGIYDGSSEFDFIYKTSMLPDPEQNAKMITFFKGCTDEVQFLLRGTPGSPWEGQWFLLHDENVVLEDFVETPHGDVVARNVSMGWDVDGEPGLDVQITLDAGNAFGEYSNPYNGFTYEYIPRVSLSPAIITTDPPASFTVDIMVTNVTALRAWDIQIRWNPQIISFVSMTEGPFLSDTGVTEFLYNTYIGYILSAACTIKGAGSSNSTGRLATVTFNCYDTGDPFNITVDSSTLLNPVCNEIVHTASGALVQTQSPVVQSSRKVTTDVSGQRANDQNPAPGDTVRFDARLSYAQPKLVGDVDRSGRVDIGDSNLVGTNWFKTEGTGMLWDADIDRSGRVDLADSNLVGKYWFNVGGKIANFTWNFGDGTVVFGKDKSVVTHVFAAYSDADGYTVTLTIKDGVGKEWLKTKQAIIWRDIVAVDIWPCYDDYLGMDSVMPGENIAAGTILFPTGAYRNMGTLKQTWVATIFVMNTATKANTTIFTRTRTNQPPTTKADMWYPPTATGTGMQVNDPNMTNALATSAKLMFVDYYATGTYDVGMYDRPIWDTDNSGNVTVGDIDCTAGAVIGALDADIGTALTVDAHLKWADNDADGAFDIGERVYYDTDASGTVNAGDYYVWLESFYYGVVYDVQIFAVPTGSYQFVMTVTTAQPDLDLTNNEFVYTPTFNVP